MDRILIILKKENGPRASSATALGLNIIRFKYVYWYMKQISGERLQDHWSSVFFTAALYRSKTSPCSTVVENRATLIFICNFTAQFASSCNYLIGNI